MKTNDDLQKKFDEMDTRIEMTKNDFPPIEFIIYDL